MHIHVHIRVHAHAHAHHVHALVATCLVAAVPSVAHGRSPRCTRSQPVVRTAAGVDDLKVAIDRKDIKKTTAALGKAQDYSPPTRHPLTAHLLLTCCLLLARLLVLTPDYVLTTRSARRTTTCHTLLTRVPTNLPTCSLAP